MTSFRSRRYGDDPVGFGRFWNLLPGFDGGLVNLSLCWLYLERPNWWAFEPVLTCDCIWGWLACAGGAVLADPRKYGSMPFREVSIELGLSIPTLSAIAGERNPIPFTSRKRHR
jgi:hypothetical protein